jgi:ComF family protein
MAQLLSEWLPRTESFRPGRLAAAVLDVLLPPTCVLCSTPVDEPGLLCGPCFGDLSAIGEPFCVNCGTPFELAWHSAEGGLCQRCIDAPPPFERARAALIYDNASRRMVLPFKHGDRIEFAQVLARLMARAGAKLLLGADVVVPVPLHRRRLFVRRYNQAALLAQALGRIGGRAVVVDAILRTRATHSLDAKSAAERKDEVAGAFTVRPRRVHQVAGRRILLIDDVMTSGATTGACAESLLAAGATAVDVLVAVRVPDRRIGQVVRRSYRRRKVQSAATTPSPASPGHIETDS